MPYKSFEQMFQKFYIDRLNTSWQRENETIDQCLQTLTCMCKKQMKTEKALDLENQRKAKDNPGLT